MRTVYIKSSSFPLIPQLTAGTSLDRVREKMEELEAKHGKPVRLSYQTANKVGAMSNAKDIFSDELEDIEETMLELSRDSFRIQQDVPFKSDQVKEDKVSMGTQMFKLLFGDGVMKAKGFAYNGEELDGQQLYDRYNSVFTDLVASKRKKLFRELGLDDNGEPVDSSVTMEKLQSLLKSEAEKRGYPIQDIKGLELEEKADINGNTYQEFKVPLWLSTNSNRYESLLNSIVSNRLMNFKIPGNSFVAGSETGFATLSTLDDMDRSRIIRLQGWNGQELQGAKEVDGKMQPAQVLMPSKFKDANGNLMDLYQKKNGAYVYLVENEDGTFGLNMDMVDPALLRNFSFRTPTSSHVSGSNIEIVGILPPEVGDLMIVPKNFTKQKGLDYDIDKETAYQLNHIVETNGKISILSEEHRESRLKGLLDALEKEQLIKDSPEDRLMRAMLGDAYEEAINDKLTNIQEKIDLVNEKFDEKLLENEFIKIHMAVFSNPDTEVQKKINKVLSMKFASGQADMIEALSDNQDVTSFTMLSDEYQKKKMGLGAAGKLAIGVYSNYVTFHGLSQQVPDPLRLMENVGEDEMVPKEVVMGNLRSDGTLGRERTLDGERSVAEVFAERQNTATDNEKEQILGRVNINSTTINVDSLLTALGFDKDSNGNSISYLLLSQPILREYVSRMENGKGIVSDYVRDLQERTVADLVSTYSNGNLVYSEGSLLTSDTYEEVDWSTMLTGDNMLEGISSFGEDKKVQLAALAKFLELDTYARSISRLQSVLNTNNLGKSIVESAVLFRNLADLPNNQRVANAFSLIGDSRPIEGGEAPEGYHIVGDNYMQARTPQGQIVLEGTRLGNSLWNSYFPYNDRYFNSVVNETLIVSNTDTESSFKEIEGRQEVIREIKKYIYSRKNNGLFTDTANNERKRLFMDSDTNVSLARYLNDITNRGKKFGGFSQGTNAVKENRLLNKFSYSLGNMGEPSLIKFNNTSNDNFDEEYLYNSFAELIVEDRPLPDLNGSPYSTRELAQDLITYAYIEGGIQEAIQFIKYVPIEYLESVGVRSGDRFVSAANVMQSYNSNRRPDIFQKVLGHRETTENSTHLFTKQYIQHFPEKARQYSKEQQKQLFSPQEGKGSKMTSFILNSDDRPKFISMRVPTKSKRKQDKFHLFEHQGNSLYKRISILGTHGMSEYQYNEQDAKSLLDNVDTRPKKEPNIKKATAKMLTNPFDITDDSLPADVMEMISNTKFERYKNLPEAARALIPVLKESTNIKVRRGTNASGRYNRKEDTIYLDVDNSLMKGPEKTARTFVHESVHSVTSTELRKYYESDGNTLRSDITVPGYVTNLHLVFNEFKKHIGAEATEVLKKKLDDRKPGLPTEFNENDAYIYGSVNIFEFVTTALTEPKFQEEMSKVMYKRSNMTLVDKFREAVMRILRALNPDIKSGSLAESALLDTLVFIEEETLKRQKNNTFDTFKKNVDTDFDPDTQTPQEPVTDLLPESNHKKLPDCI
jgi:23S rRNA maturation mini-RNase III